MTDLQLIQGGIASHDSPAGLESALYTLHAVEQPPCSCKDPTCRAQTLFLAKSPLYDAASDRCFKRIQGTTGSRRKHEDGTWHEKTSTGGWLQLRVVVVSDVDLASGIGSIRYTWSPIDGAQVIPGQAVSEDDADYYLPAANAIGMFEDSVGAPL